MQLTRLEVKGFKSFGDKITINFDEGVTAIVGPNGCGKSNVVDSIRWVLGEQSTRMLRSEKMENIIFNGTKSRKPANLAEVSLTFDNTKNILPTEYSQVTLTRKLYRTGESEYRLNDVQCRLKDITDLFLDTGIGSDSYAIIELKMIDEIITNKEGSRRNLFEEASGISKYKLRKKQTFARLKDTEADLERVQDLLFEIEKNLKTLENQAKKAERYYRLKEQYKELSIALASIRIATFGQSLASIEEQERQQYDIKLSIVTEADKLEALIQQQKLDSLTREKNLSVQQKATNEFVAKIRSYESERKIKNEQLKFEQAKETRLVQELEQDKNQLNHVLYTIKRLAEDQLRDEETLHTLQSQVTDLKEAVDDLRSEQTDARNELQELTNINNRLQNQIYKAEKDLDILYIQQQALEQESRRNMEDASGKEMELSHFNQAVAELQYRSETTNQQHQAAVDFENQLQEKIKETEAAIVTQKDVLNQQSRQLDAKQNEYNLTKSLVDSLEGFPESIRFLKKNAAWVKKAPLLSDIIFCPEDCRVAIENYLEPVMNYFVVNTYDDAIEAINLLSQAARGRAQFFILDNYADQAAAAAPIEAEGLIPALSIIETDAVYRPLCNYLLRNVYLIDDNAYTVINNDTLPGNMVLLGKSGKFSKSKFTMAGGSVGLFEGKRIGRGKSLEILAGNIKTFQAEIQQHKSKIEQLQSELTALKQSGKTTEIKLLQQELNRLHTELITVKTRQEQHQAFIANSNNRKEDIARKMEAIGNEMATLTPQLAELKTQKEIQQDAVLNSQQAYNELTETITVQSNRYNQQNIAYHQQQNRVSGLLKDLEYREAQQESLEKRISQNTAELEKVKAALLSYAAQSSTSDDDLLEMYEQRDELEKATRHAEQEYYAMRGEITEAENTLLQLRRKKDQAELIENELKDKRNNLRIELNALKERLSVEFNVDIQELLEAEADSNVKEDELRERTQKLKKQLDEYGAINPMAMEAYQEMNQRYEFIQNQKKDLAEAKQVLLNTIQEIDDTAREKFMSAFVMVRENFIKVFRSLFNEEDSCDLILTDPQHPLESDIDIIARPKGKRPLSINQLSGGEKTLTATAILFSLYLLKPAPFCIFDEVDAPLDDTNIDKFNNIIRKFSNQSQFIVVSHNKKTIASTDVIYGVTMVEQGISRVVPVDLRQLAG
ncbi:chromosome segregation protein SMC [Mucilaginibacter koreensis]